MCQNLFGGVKKQRGEPHGFSPSPKSLGEDVAEPPVVPTPVREPVPAAWSVDRHAGRGEFKTDARFLAGADGHSLSASNRLAVADDLGLERVRVLFIGIENRSGEHARSRRGLSD